MSTVAALLIPAAPSWGASVASFVYSPGAPLSGQVVSFVSTSTGTVSTEEWDLDSDGVCDDASGAVARRSFSVPGRYSVRLCVNSGESQQQQTIDIRDRPPHAAIVFSPASPLAGQTVTLASKSTDADGPIMSHSWGFGNDGAPDDAAGVTTTHSWGRPGVFPVFLHVTDGFGLAGDTSVWIRVRKRPPEMLSPFPVVRLVGRFTRSGAVVRRLAVTAPTGARVSVRCRGAQCPYRVAVARAAGIIRFQRLQRPLNAGTVIAVSVTRRGKIGKYTRLRIRRGKAPARIDRCLFPGKRGPEPCPS